MYHFFQAHMKKIFWALLFLIIPPFCFFGNFSMGSREKVVGEMYGKPVKENQFQRAYNAVSLEALLRYGENYHKFLKFLNLDQQAWDRMILLKKAKDMDIEVSDSELRNYLVKLFSVPGEKGPVFD
ncbi:MAG: SurA N-terminal domain-containing protein, partial [Candidatus Aureabacteria bacterium]|nr:SurA N-terminal domain-containing protein [Candidatus Auribacterota bacterium]